MSACERQSNPVYGIESRIFFPYVKLYSANGTNPKNPIGYSGADWDNGAVPRRRQEPRQPSRIGERVREIRTYRGWSDKELSERTGEKGNYVWRIESGAEGNPGWKKIESLAGALGVDPWLLCQPTPVTNDFLDDYFARQTNTDSQALKHFDTIASPPVTDTRHRADTEFSNVEFIARLVEVCLAAASHGEQRRNARAMFEELAVGFALVVTPELGEETKRAIHDIRRRHG
jgi:transcriptional regulator with XRE-family HTH domain